MKNKENKRGKEKEKKEKEEKKERGRERGEKEKERIKKEGMKVRNRQRERVRICKKMFKSGYIRKDLGSMDGLTKKPYYRVVVYLISKMMHLFIPLLQ